MGTYDTCKTEVEGMGGTMCDYNRCLRIQQQIDSACHARSWEPGSPYILDNPDGTVCYCCCSCFFQDTPIAVAENAFKLVQDIKTTDTVLAAYQVGTALEWRETVVDFVTNVGDDPGETNSAFMVTLAYDDGIGGTTYLIVTEDHLFLLPSGELIPASAVNANDQLTRPDGSPVPITAVLSGMKTGGVYQLATGETWEGVDGHLLNSNGVVSADFALQAGYISGQLDPSLLVGDLDSRLRVGSEEYEATLMTSDAKRLVGDPTQWPAGFKITLRKPLYNVPADAKRFILDSQANEILNNVKAKRRPYDSNFGIEMAEYLFTIFKGFYPKPLYVYDWNNQLPNAYTWNATGTDYIMLTGGLLRQYAMNRDGLAMVICHCLASLYGRNPDGSLGISCVGLADYDGLTGYFGNIYRDQSFVVNKNSALAQYGQFFGYAKPGGSGDKCTDPGLQCRIDTIKAAAGLAPLPDCADPQRTGFNVVSAFSKKGNGTVKVTFSKPVNVNTGGTSANYSLRPFVDVTKAKVQEGDQKVVVLDAVIKEGVEYTLQVRNVTSNLNRKLDPARDTVKFKLSD